MSKLVLVRSPYQVFWPRTLGKASSWVYYYWRGAPTRILAQVPYSLGLQFSLTSLPSVEELILFVLLVVYSMKISSSTEGKLVRAKL